MATRPGVTPAPPRRRAGASARAQQPITGLLKKATAAEAAELAAARMEAIAAAAKKLVLGLLAALEKPPAPKPPPERGARKPRGDWWRPELIWPLCTTSRGWFSTAAAGLVDRFPVVYGALPPSKPDYLTGRGQIF